MSLISCLNIAQQALSVNQAAISVVSNNIANVDTPGYSKWRVNQAAVINYTPSAGNKMSLAQSGSGVTIDSVQRYSNSYLQNYYWQENSGASYLSKYSTIASNIEDLTNELKNTGLSEALTNFYAAANALSSNPSDITARQNYIQQAQNVSAVFNNMSKNLNDMKATLVGDPNKPGTLGASEIASQADSVNSLLDQIAKVNFDIVKTNSSDSSAPALLDKRDALVSKLTALIPVSVKENSNGTIDVSIGENKLVAGSQVSAYLKVTSGTASNPVIVSLVDKNSASVAANINGDIASGSIGAILTATGDSNGSNLTLNGVLVQLNKMANNFASVLNSVQTTVGYPDSNGTNTTPMAIDSNTGLLIPATQNIFQTNDGSGTITAGNISVNQNIITDPNLIAAARVTSVVDTMTVGDNSNMTLLLNLRTQPNGGLQNLSLEGYLSSVVSGIGSDVNNINSNAENQNLVLNEIQTKLSSATGVNLDEELVDLVKYQRAYQAAARIFSVCNDLMGELVNLGK